MLTVPNQESPRYSDKQSSQKSLTSESSNKNKPQKKTKCAKRVSKLQIDQLNERVKTQFLKNKKTYDKLLSMNPYFSMKLYAPNNNFTTDDYDTSSVDLMMKQLELLLDDGHALEKEIMKTTLRKSQHESKDNNYLDQWRHHFAYLRKVWSNPNQEQASKPLDLIEQLNKKVVIIKNNIYSTMQMQKKCYDTRNSENHDQYELVTRKINEVTQEVGEYTLLKEKYENLRMTFEDIYEKYYKLTQEMKEKLQTKNQLLENMKIQNEELKKIVKEYKEKILSSQAKQTHLLGKIKQLQLLQKEKKEEKQSLESSLSHSILKTSQLLNFDKIRFTRMENKQLLLNRTEDQKVHHRNNLSHTISVFETHDKEDVQIKPFQESPNQESLENINCLNGQRECRLDISIARSIEKKGRFVRMRSPCNGKLLKIREEELIERRKSDFCSPRMKQMKEKRGPEVVASQS